MTDNDLKKLVLFTLGYKGNIDFSDAEDEIANKINFVYENLIRETLSKYRWSFCIETIQLTEKTELINQKYKFAYILPKDFIVLINPFADKDRNSLINDYEIKKTFNVNYSNPFINYNSRIDTEDFPSYFIQYIKYKIAFELCYDLTGDTDLMQILKQKENEEFIIAKNTDAKQQPTRIIKSNPYYYARF